MKKGEDIHGSHFLLNAHEGKSLAGMDEKKRRKWKKKNKSHPQASKASPLAQAHSNSSSSSRLEENENESSHQRGVPEGVAKAHRAGESGEDRMANVMQEFGGGDDHDGLLKEIAQVRNGGEGEGGRANMMQEFGNAVSSKRSNGGCDLPACEACSEHLATMARLKAEVDAKDQVLHNLVDALAAGPINTAAVHSSLSQLEAGLSSHSINQASVTGSVEQLKAYLAQLRKHESDQMIVEDGLRGEIEQLKGDVLELRAMQEQREVQTEEAVREENLLLREESLRLQKEVEEIKDTNKKLILERWQLMPKMMALQTGMHQLEQEATAHAQVGDELIVMPTKTESQKGLLRRTSSKDISGAVTAVAEDSAVQTAAAAAMVEKLSTENAALIEKVNEQSALIERLSHNYSYAMQLHENGLLGVDGFGKSDLGIETSENNDELPSINPKGVIQPALETLSRTGAGESQDEREVPNVGILHQPAFETLSRTGAGESQDEREVPNVGILPECTSKTDSAIKANATIVVTRDDSEHQFVSEGVELAPHLISSQSRQQDAFMTPLEVKPFSDAPIMGAPIRLFSFLAKYVSGADLVKVKGPN